MSPSSGWSWVGRRKAGQIGRVDVGEAAALDQKIALGAHVGQHVGQNRRKADEHDQADHDEVADERA